jgi:SPP1 gp7 family putative phage head morphogenesis protein
MKLAKGDRVLRPVHANAGIGAAYRQAIENLVEEMTASYAHFLKAQYKRNPPAMALDATPAKELQRELSLLGKRWEKRFNEAAPKLARWFATRASRRSEASLKAILKEAGISVEFQMSKPMKDAFEATVFENVSLIKSVGEQYHRQIEGTVMRSVTAGRDLSILAKDLEHTYGVTKKRAALISRDQNNKATAVMTRARQEEVGITKAVWLHSHGGKTPRKTHWANNGKPYDPAKGWFDPDPKVRKYIWPGTEINCRCVSRSVVKGFS